MTIYVPADNTEEATHLFTTTEIHDAINRLNPTEYISKELIYDRLLEEGYKWVRDPEKSGFSLKWMMIRIA